MNEALTNFIEKRINSNYYKLRKDVNWKKANDEYNASYKKFYDELQEEQQKRLDNIIDLKNILMGYESNFGYKVGASDMKEGVIMSVITKQEINAINGKCSNGWLLDVQYYMFHNERTLIKQIPIDDEHYLEFRLCYSNKKQILVHISKFHKKPNEQCAVTTGLGKNAIIDETEYKRKNINNLLALTNRLNNFKLMELNKNTKVSNGYGLIMQSPEF